MTNRETFAAVLTAVYTDLFANDPEYGYAASRHTPASLAQKMTDGLVSKSANKDGEGIRRACKALGVPHTYKALDSYLSQ